MLPGSVVLETVSYDFDNLQAPDGTRPRNTSNAVVNVPAPSMPGERRRIEIGGGGSLTLHGLFRRAATESLRDLRVSGAAGFSSRQDGDQSSENR